MAKQIVRFDLSELKKDVVDLSIDRINAQISKACTDIGIREAERQEKIVLLAMAKHYLELRKAADELFEAAKHPFRHRKRLLEALDAYESERHLTVVVEPKSPIEYISGERVVS